MFENYVIKVGAGMVRHQQDAATPGLLPALLAFDSAAVCPAWLWSWSTSRISRSTPSITGNRGQRAVREHCPGRPQQRAPVVEPGGCRERCLQPFADHQLPVQPATAARPQQRQACGGRSCGRLMSVRFAGCRSPVPLTGLRINASRQGCRMPGPNTQLE